MFGEVSSFFVDEIVPKFDSFWNMIARFSVIVYTFGWVNSISHILCNFVDVNGFIIPMKIASCNTLVYLLSVCDTNYQNHIICNINKSGLDEILFVLF